MERKGVRKERTESWERRELRKKMEDPRGGGKGKEESLATTNFLTTTFHVIKYLGKCYYLSLSLSFPHLQTGGSIERVSFKVN